MARPYVPALVWRVKFCTRTKQCHLNTTGCCDFICQGYLLPSLSSPRDFLYQTDVRNTSQRTREQFKKSHIVIMSWACNGIVIHFFYESCYWKCPTSSDNPTVHCFAILRNRPCVFLRIPAFLRNSFNYTATHLYSFFMVSVAYLLLISASRKLLLNEDIDIGLYRVQDVR
jgi:hypothetical protein